ncbi:5-formyltetrahydrofolate cyclo-ligase [Muricauda sp. SCSIO 64092]|uniref:5-formyltetrahydrofolate cyclo-ligase n=1 Tax=Allomuricauda sp. SCSIO 64092 TaxID=2908842 RepID=UPI001FF235DA|nr:5-formyltetrahydrofolate cyclo-ligase [Muricauda sp. SCSIO 64092]UOY09185.1 5-formyltetrahydrofolate cyclo-ligase [Muricauda sp. SCSIO 64092]
MHKKALRLDYRNKRNLLEPSIIDSSSLEIANQILHLPIWQYTFYHIFLSITKNKELDTQPLLSILQGKDKTIVVPKTYPNGILRNYLLLDNTVIESNGLGIPEPKEGIEISADKLDVVFVPLLAFDKNGHRVGYGGGYYDRFLKNCRNDLIKVGLSFFGPVEEITDSNTNDVRLTYCVTPNRIYEF